jgi:hypothetical protein
VRRRARFEGVGVYLGGRAIEITIKSLSKSDDLKIHVIVHFATHGLLAGETANLTQVPSRTALLLTPPKVAGEENDGPLTAGRQPKATSRPNSERSLRRSKGVTKSSSPPTVIARASS